MSDVIQVDVATAGSPALDRSSGELWILLRYRHHVLDLLRFTDPALAAEVVQKARVTYAGIIAARLASACPPRLSPGEISVIVCTRDRPELLRGTLEAMTRLDPAPGQILVVDNAPTDVGTRREAATAGVDYVVEERPGLDHARNAGWSTARGSVIAFVDDDARPDPYLVGAATSAFFESRIGAATGLVVGAELRSWAQLAFERRGGMRKGVQRLLFTPGSVGLQAFRLGAGTNMAFRREALARIGGFDPGLDVGTPSRGGGDLDALWRVLDADFDVVYDPDMLVHHIHRRTARALLGQHRDYGTAYRAFLERVEQDDPDRRHEVRAEVRRWHLSRHAASVVRALGRGDAVTASLLTAELFGSTRGRRSVIGVPSRFSTT